MTITPTRDDIVNFKKAHNLTAREMADMLPGVSVRTVQCWIDGSRNCPPLAWYVLYCKMNKGVKNNGPGY